MTNGMIQCLLQWVLAGAWWLAQLRHILPLTTRQMVTAIWDAPKDVRHVIVTQCIHVWLGLVANHCLDVTQGSTQNGDTLGLATLVEGSIYKSRVDGLFWVIRLIGGVFGGHRITRNVDSIFHYFRVCLAHAYHHHTSLMNFGNGVHFALVDAGVLYASVPNLQDPSVIG